MDVPAGQREFKDLNNFRMPPVRVWETHKRVKLDFMLIINNTYFTKENAYGKKG